MNRFFTCTDLIAEYRLPQHVHNQIFAEVVPVEKTDQGEPLYLEAQVDAWLTVRYAVAPWRSGFGLPSTVLHFKKVEHENAFVTVTEAQHRNLAGERSKRWWYRMAETGRIAHHRVGDSILFRTDDIEKFITESRKGEHTESPKPESASAIPVVPPPLKPQPRTKPVMRLGFGSFHGDGRATIPLPSCGDNFSGWQLLRRSTVSAQEK